MKKSLVFMLVIILGWIYTVSSESVRNVSVSSTVDTTNIVLRKKIVSQVLLAPMFYPFTQEKLDVSIDGELIEPRGRMKGRSITLSSGVARDTEFLQLFFHEFAHFIDIYALRASPGRSDISQDFYAISWTSTTTKRAGQKQQNFISGYAATNQYEDFAESFVFYVFHNRAFVERAMRDDIIRQKYIFLRTHVFPEGHFVDTDFSLGRVPSYLWDTTKLPISLQKYLYSLN